ncbi:MAG: DNA repair protein [Pirellulaceae bacterium]|nr:MAG: DNA repair protein [Pirellulaceae bacterium]
MPRPSEEEKRRRKYLQVLEVLKRQRTFDKEEVVSTCQEASSVFISRLINELVADQAIVPRVDDDADGATLRRFEWRIDVERFDVEAWVHQRLHGSQVNQTPTQERPRERLLNVGVGQLKTSELLAILIRSGRPGESAVQAGQKVAKAFESRLEQLIVQSPADLKAVSPAISEVAYCQIMAGIELGRRVESAVRQRRPAAMINSTDAAIAYCREAFARLAYDGQQEEFHIVTLDTKLRPIHNHRITVGTLDASLVHPREVFRPAIRDAASAVLLVHNHPSGDPTPSREDFQVTERLRSCGDLLGIRVIDHIVVARERAISLVECG